MYQIRGYWFGRIPDIRLNSKYRIFFSKINIYIFSFQQNLPTFLVAISLLFSTYWKCSEKCLFIRVCIICSTVYPDIRPAGSRISKRPDIWYNPTLHDLLYHLWLLFYFVYDQEASRLHQHSSTEVQVIEIRNIQGDLVNMAVFFW